MATSKKRRLNTGDAFITQLQPVKIQYSPVQFTPNPIPTPVVNAQTPQDLTYSVLTSGKDTYKKEEVLTIIGKMDKMLAPKFSPDCDYIS